MDAFATRRRKSAKDNHCIYLAVVKKKNNETRVLMVRRKNPILGVIDWAFPGGKRKADEAPEECVRREVFEETGCLVNPLGEISERNSHPISQASIVYYACVLEGEAGKLVSLPEKEIEEVRWMTLEEVEKSAHRLDPKVKRFLVT